MIKGRKQLLRLIFMTTLLLVTPLPLSAQQDGKAGAGAGASDWRREFDAICASVDRSLELAQKDLEQLLFRCRLLEQRIEQLQGPEKKVFTRRLAACRDVLQFVLDQGTADGAGTGAGGGSSNERSESR